MSQIADSDAAERPLHSGGAAVTLDTRFELVASGLSVRYKLTNTRGHPIYVFNVLWDFDAKGRYIAAPQPVYASLRSDGMLKLAKMILPVPRGRMVELRIVPFVTRVEAGQCLEETLVLPLPVAEYNPYTPALPNSKYKSAQARSVAFWLQFVNDVPDMKTPPAALAGAIHLQHPKLLALVETVQSKPEPLAVPVNKREDQFEEF